MEKGNNPLAQQVKEYINQFVKCYNDFEEIPIDPEQELIAYHQEKERIQSYLADKDNPRIYYVLDIKLFNSHPDIANEIFEAYMPLMFTPHETEYFVLMVESDLNRCDDGSLLDEVGRRAYLEWLEWFKYEPVDCAILGKDIDPNIRRNQMIALAKTHDESYGAYIITDDNSIHVLAEYFGVRCLSYEIFKTRLGHIKEYRTKRAKKIFALKDGVEGQLDWGLLLPEYRYSGPMTYSEYIAYGRLPLEYYIENGDHLCQEDFEDEEEPSEESAGINQSPADTDNASNGLEPPKGQEQPREGQNIPQRDIVATFFEEARKRETQANGYPSSGSSDWKENISSKQFTIPVDFWHLPFGANKEELFCPSNEKLRILGAKGMEQLLNKLYLSRYLKGEEDKQLLFYRLTGHCRPKEQGDCGLINWIPKNGHFKDLMYLLKYILPEYGNLKYEKARLFFADTTNWPSNKPSTYAEGASAQFQRDMYEINPIIFPKYRKRVRNRKKKTEQKKTDQKG